MIQRGTLEVSPDKNIALHLGAYATIAVIVGMAWVPANAYAARTPGMGVATLVTDHTNTGNGRHNRNSVSVRSPAYNHGYQHTNNGNSGGLNPVQNAICAHATVCNVTQKIIVVRPERVVRKAPQRIEAPLQEPDAPPQKPDISEREPGIPVEQSAVPAQRSEAPSPPLEAPTPEAGAAAPTHPFMYTSPYGIMLLPGASAWSGFGGRPDALECLRRMSP